MRKIKVLVWNENIHEKTIAEVQNIYPDGIHGCIAEFLENAGFDVSTATLEMPSHGLTQEALDQTDVLIWWGHMAHDQVSDEAVERVHQRIMDGMGLIVLHSGHGSKIFRRICGTNTQLLKWREIGETEILWTVEQSHPIAEGLDEHIVIPHAEMYGERFDIPKPDELVFIGWFEGGNVFRSGCCFYRGKGRIFYLQPGHETYPIYHMPEIQKILINAAKWAKAPALVATSFDQTPIMPVSQSPRA